MKITSNTIADLSMKIKKNENHWALLLSLVVWVSCSSKELKPSDYLRYYAENAVRKLSDQKASDSMRMVLTYQPLNLLVINDLGTGMTQSQYEESKSHFSEHLYFTFDVGSSTPLSKETGKALRDYFAHDRQRQFVLISHQDTIPCRLYQPELVSRGDKQVRVNLVFPRPVVAGQPSDAPLDEDLYVRFYDDKTHQPFSFLIKKDNVNQLPKIKI